MKTLKIIMCDGSTVCRSGRKVCEIKQKDNLFRVFMIDKLELKITKNEIKEVIIS